METNEEKLPPGTPDTWSIEELRDAPPPRSFLDDRVAGLSAREMRSAAFMCAALLAAFAITGLLLGKLHPSLDQITLSHCAQVPDEAKRLGCYDRLANGVQLPSKGGSPFSD